jgi:NAD(P)-dependent dehydrogenase (short-subunit alcohol dehydrogenase family)
MMNSRAGALSEHTALIFGASSGIGRATALAFGREGAAVAVAARGAGALGSVCDEINAGGGRAVAVPADVSQRTQVDRAIERTIELLGGFDIVINAAGTNVPNRQIAQLTQTDWDTIIAVNLTGAFNTLHASLPHLRARGGGLIIQVSSISGRWSDASGPAYQASKAGIIGLCQGTMFEERLNGIRVSAVLPGLTDTPLMLKRAQPPPREVLDQAMQPDDLAMACVFLSTLPPRTYVPELILMPGALQCVGAAAR